MRGGTVGHSRLLHHLANRSNFRLYLLAAPEGPISLRRIADERNHSFTAPGYAEIMSFEKPIRAALSRREDSHRHKQQNVGQKATPKILSLAAAVGAIAGTGSIALSNDGRAKIGAVVRPVAVQAGAIRARDPQPGDFWRGCDEARAAGTAPIYSGEPGYSERMDGDSDGIACEPYR